MQNTFPLFVLLAGGALAPVLESATAYDKAYPMSPVGEVQVKTLPNAKVLVAEDKGTYFEKNNGLFSALFNYIQKHDVAMTTPVEGALTNAVMRFYVGADDKTKDLRDGDRVKVQTLPRRTVLALGVKGSYSQDNVTEAVKQLQNWMTEHPHYKKSGDPYAVYWNSPFVPWFLKRSEIHIPIVEPK